ncbi:hypothetical protein K438DRAFT_353736 [Mycena galopus ATCC 62051]|nr:hypothetical protein K438DRAFT_353736 [Mycena galopus ATCC 62051]
MAQRWKSLFSAFSEICITHAKLLDHPNQVVVHPLKSPATMPPPNPKYHTMYIGHCLILPKLLQPISNHRTVDS